MSIEDTLRNWSNWARASSGRQVSIIGQFYKPGPYEAENGELVSNNRPSQPVIDILDAERTEKAILKLPKEPYNAPRLIVYHYVTPYLPLRRECRKMGVKVYRYEECLSETLNNLKQALEAA